MLNAYIILNGAGIVQNIEMYETYDDANRVAGIVYGDGACAEEYRYNVGPGDRKVDGEYYRVAEDGTLSLAEYIPTEKQRIEQLQDENAELTIALADMIGGAGNAE